MNALRIGPFCLRPAFDVRPWGVRNLAPVYDRTVGADENPVGEAWLTGEHCEVRDGALRGERLGELCRVYGRELVGSASPYGDRFPLLLKFLFTDDRLSVQVHPDDEAAKSVGEPCGKTECWYVVNARPDATIALGLKPGVTTSQFRSAIQENRAEELMNWVGVRPKDMIYVAAGTVHTIGAGAVIFEVQQNSDMTYRLYDYGRPRELHLEAGMAALKECTDAGKIRPVPLDAKAERLIAKSHFTVERHCFEGRKEFYPKKGLSAQCLVALEGSGTITGSGFAPVAFEKSEAVVVPASVDDFAIEARESLELLFCTLPG